MYKFFGNSVKFIHFAETEGNMQYA